MSTEPTVRTACLPIAGGDYDGGGAASKHLKEMLKKIGVAPETVRRTMIAAYEAEMNVVIHACKGEMHIAVDPSQVDVAVIDEGPGIPDVDLAMQQGYSTAPAVARELGFGAGMGLPNIKSNSDRFSLVSKLGRGTQLRFTIYLKCQEESQWTPNSLRVTERPCCKCLACIHICPAQAVRVRNDKPLILNHLCLDCTSCIAACPEKVFDVDASCRLPEPASDTELVLPQSFLEQFGARVSPNNVLEVLHELGYQRIRLLEEWENALRTAVADYAQGEGINTPVLSPACPAVVNLIRVRFPSLLNNLAPFLTPIEAAREETTAPHAVFLPVCPAQSTILRQPAILTRLDVVNPAIMRREVQQHPHLQREKNRPSRCPAKSRETLQVYGIDNVLRVLDAIENGFADDCSPMELYACDQTCFGSPLWKENAFVARSRYESTDFVILGLDATEATAIRRVESLSARTGLRLDGDMRKAIEKLGQIEDLTRRLPGRNCGVCGAPTCTTLAEDIVLGRGKISDCAYYVEEEGDS